MGANGTSRNALAQMQLKREAASAEQSELMAITKRGYGEKIPLKASASEHNHSSDSFRTRK